MSMMIGHNVGISSNYLNNTSKTSGYKNVREYSNYLMGKYSCFTPGKNVAVSVTPGMLRKAMNDEKTEQWLERELAKAPDYIKEAQQSASARGSRLISASIEFGEEYTTMCVCTVTDLKTCMNNPEKAAYLEENLAAIPNCIKRSVEYTKNMPGNPVMTYCNVSFDENGNITMTSGCTNFYDGT